MIPMFRSACIIALVRSLLPTYTVRLLTEITVDWMWSGAVGA